MDALTFLEMANDKNAMNLKKMSYKYKLWFEDYLELMKSHVYEYLPVLDFNGNKTAFVKGQTKQTYERDLLFEDGSSFAASIDEIYSTSKIENINFSRNSIKRVLQNKAPRTADEEKILGIKNGLEFISNQKNKITEENLFKLFALVLGEDEKQYRDAPVYVVGEKVEHTGIEAKKLPSYMKNLIKYANEKDETDPLVKASIIHFYFAYLHPFFDGNGRMARMLHLWFLVQQGFTGALYVPFSKSIEETKTDYYKAFTLIEENYKISNVIDVTPFIVYFQNEVYPKMKKHKPLKLDSTYTVKEVELWDFINKNYRNEEFTTKRLEKDFNNAAFATVRSFCLKFTEKGLLSSRQQANKVLYKVN